MVNGLCYYQFHFPSTLPPWGSFIYMSVILRDWKWKIPTNDLRDPQPIVLFLKINTFIFTILRNGNRKQSHIWFAKNLNSCHVSLLVDFWYGLIRTTFQH